MQAFRVGPGNGTLRAMRTWKKLPLLTAIAAALTVPATASAQFQHVVASGERPSSVPAADRLPVAALAAANGISADAQLIAGSAIAIPPQDGSVSAPGDESSGAAPALVQTSTTVGSSAGGYLVEPGDTLSAIAGRYGVSVSALAADNGLDPAGLLI